jgi:hypothetical protein
MSPTKLSWDVKNVEFDVEFKKWKKFNKVHPKEVLIKVK